MSTIDDAMKAAEWISAALVSSGYEADFSPASLWQIERFFRDHVSHGTAVRGGLLDQDLGMRLFALGAYVGEVARRNLGGDWVVDENDPQSEIKIAMRRPDGACCWPVMRVMNRFKNGPDESIAAFGIAFGLQVGPDPKRRR